MPGRTQSFHPTAAATSGRSVLARAVAALLVWATLLPEAGLLAQTNFAVLANDGAWNWYSDPRALFHKGALYFGYVRNSDGKTVLSAFDPRTGVTTDLWASTLNERDEYNVPSVVVRPDGRMLAVYSRHNSDPFFSYRISTGLDPSSHGGWGEERRIPNTGAAMSYAHAVQLADEGRIFNFSRNLNFNPTLFVSTNGGVTWSSPQSLIQTGERFRPYVKICSDEKRRMDFVYTDGHPRNTANSLYHVYYQAGAFYRTDGTLVKRFANLPILHGAGESGSVIYQCSDAPQSDPNQWIPAGRAWVWDVAGTASGRPACVFTVRGPKVTGDNWQDSRIYYYYARWTGTQWQKRFIAHAGRPLYEAEEHYAGGICIDPDDPNVIYLSSNAADPFALGDLKPVPLRPNARYELWRGVTTNGGLTFNWQAITTNSPADNLRPCVPRGQRGMPTLLWFRGDYVSYTFYHCEIVGLFSSPLPRTNSTASQRSSILLTNAAQVRELTREAADERFPVKLRGTVIAEPQIGGEGFAMQDETAGIYLRGPAPLISTIQRGDLIEAEGVSDSGEFAPFVWLTSLRKLGRGIIPAPRPVSFEQLITGRSDAQWVEVSGVVRSCEPIQPGKKYKLEVATGGGRLPVQIVGQVTAENLIDAEVRLPGVSFYQVNKSRQVISPLLVVPHGAFFVVETPAPLDPYAAPVKSVGSLLQFAPQGAYGHRVHVRGVVTHQSRGESLWIQDDTRGLCVQALQTNLLQPGDVVDVLGFPNRGDYSPVLEDAVFRKSTSGPSPSPVSLADAALAVNHDAALVELEAELTDRQLTDDGWAFLLRAGAIPFQARLRAFANQTPPAQWKFGSRVSVTGICSVITGGAQPATGVSVPQSFQILLRSPADLAVIQPPAWWTWKRVVWLLGLLACALSLMIGLVIWQAKRRLREQSVQRALAEAEFAAILTERNRMAREIHDTLAQGLGAISMQLELVKGNLGSGAGAVARHLEQAHRLVRSSLADARSSIWNMRSQVLEHGDLASALKSILHQLADGANVATHLEVKGNPRRLPPVTENNLLRIGQEAITNAMKHAQAKHLQVELEFSEKELRLRVKDDGNGFNPAHPPAGDSGFGLVGMRERAAQLQGALSLQSQPGHGTDISLVVPVPG